MWQDFRHSITNKAVACQYDTGRSVMLPSGIKADAVKATFKDGVLKLALPKADSAKAKEIPILTS